MEQDGLFMLSHLDLAWHYFNAAALNFEEPYAPGEPAKPGRAGIECGQDPWDLAAGDVDGDGTLDLVIANRGAACVSIMRSARKPEAAARELHGQLRGPYRLAAGDFNGDGIRDLATLDVTDDRLTIWHGKGSGAFKALPPERQA